MKPFVLKTEGRYFGEWETLSEHDSYDEAYEEALKVHDSENDDDLKIIERGRGAWLLRGHTLEKVECPACGKTLRKRDLRSTYDCHGIFFRKVCEDCYVDIMDGKGYDGEYYTEADECIDYDY